MKLEGWDGRLVDYLQEAARREFRYGVLDCVIFACDGVELQTGIDPMDEGRGLYDDLKSGVKLISEKRGSYEGIMDFHFARHDNVMRAQRGDVVLRMVDGLKAYGLVGNGGRAYFKAQGLGLVHHFVKDCDMAWRIT